MMMFASASMRCQTGGIGDACTRTDPLRNAQSNHPFTIIRASSSSSKSSSKIISKHQQQQHFPSSRGRSFRNGTDNNNNNSTDDIRTRMCSLRRHSYCLRNRVVVSSSSSSLANEQPPGSRSSSSKNVFNSNEAGKEWNTNLRATCEAIVKVNEADDVTPELSLASYMRLPVEQYVDVPLPLGAKMTKYFDETIREDEGFFELAIPGLKFFTLEVKPVVRVKVSVLTTDNEQRFVWSGKTKANDVKAEEEEKRRKKMNKMYRPEREDADMRGPCVLIEVASCRLEGKEVESLGINEMFVNRGSTAFRWKSRGDESWDYGDLLHYGIGSAEHADADDVSSSKKEGEEEAEEEENKYAYIEGWTEIGVGVDPPGPFKKFPRSVTQSVGDAVLGFTLREIEKAFLRGLARDYERWCSDADYRHQRATAFENVGAWTEKEEVIDLAAK